MMAPWRYRRCPHCGAVRPGGDFPPVNYGPGWGNGSKWRRCPDCGAKGPTSSFPVVRDKRKEVA